MVEIEFVPNKDIDGLQIKLLEIFKPEMPRCSKCGFYYCRCPKILSIKWFRNFGSQLFTQFKHLNSKRFIYFQKLKVKQISFFKKVKSKVFNRFVETIKNLKHKIKDFYLRSLRTFYRYILEKAMRIFETFEKKYERLDNTINGFKNPIRVI